MTRKSLLPVLAVAGLIVAIIAVIFENRPLPTTRPAASAPKAPFASYVAGSGVIEASSGNIAVGTPVSGVVTAIYVKWGDHVTAGDPLFKIDDRDLQAQRLPALAREKEAVARAEQARGQLRLAESVPDKRAISVEELNNRRSAVAINSAALAAAKAQIEQIQLEIERRTVRALAPGKVLQVNLRPGEFAQSGALSTPLMVIGDDTRLYVRVDIDEFDTWRVRSDEPAEAFVRGNAGLHTALRFERVDPYVVPKTALTGSSTERTDARVLQVLYSFDPASLPGTYVGQQVDVFIQAPPPAAAGTVRPGADAS
jgi:RND family efflux transporter MFP subunit